MLLQLGRSLGEGCLPSALRFAVERFRFLRAIPLSRRGTHTEVLAWFAIQRSCSFHRKMLPSVFFGVESGQPEGRK